MNTKLRFYLRGLGIGLVVTTLILMVVRLNTHNGEMTDAEIKQRAAELGMVDANSYSLTDAANSLSEDVESRLNTEVLDKYNTEKPSETESFGSGQMLIGDGTGEADTEEETVDEDSNAGSDEVSDMELTVTDGDEDTNAVVSEDQKEDDKADTDEANKEQEKTDTDNTTTDNTVTEEKPKENVQASVGSGTITIASGSASETAASVLEKAGIITDAKDFNSYMCKNGYDRRIHPGTYTIESGLSYEEICKIIAG